MGVRFKLHVDQDPDWVVARLKHLSLSPRGPGASALSQVPRIDSACVKQLSYSIITTIPTSLIFTSVAILVFREQVAQHIIMSFLMKMFYL